MPSDPHIAAWADQFGALLRDKILVMQEALLATRGWPNMSHIFPDPADGDTWQITFESGEYYAQNLDDGEQPHPVLLDLESLGVRR